VISGISEARPKDFVQDPGSDTFTSKALRLNFLY
jgi:hypothetical protein